jgi:two-component system LytT family sensor kinase
LSRRQIFLVMSPPTSVTRRWQPWLLGFAVWTVLGLLSAAQTSIYFMRDGRPVPWTPVIIDRLADWYTCALFTPLFFWLVRAMPWERSRWWRPAIIQALIALACVPVKYVMYAGIVQWLIPDYRSVVVGRLIVGNLIYEFMAFGVMFAVIHAVEFYRRALEDTARAARLETRLAEARVEALTAQLQPHFLFNTLHAISTLMHRDVDAADTMLARLGDLLRRTLDSHNGSEVPLSEELRLLDAYLDIARVRFQDRLTVDVTIAAETNGALVPRFVLQPLVENALQHGIGSRNGRGRITIQARREGERLRLSVSDDGVGGVLRDNGFPREGIGLTNTRQRLRERYGSDHSLQLTNGEGGGLLVAVDIPFRTAVA